MVCSMLFCVFCVMKKIGWLRRDLSSLDHSGSESRVSQSVSKEGIRKKASTEIRKITHFRIQVFDGGVRSRIQLLSTPHHTNKHTKRATSHHHITTPLCAHNTQSLPPERKSNLTPSPTVVQVHRRKRRLCRGEAKGTKAEVPYLRYIDKKCIQYGCAEGALIATSAD